MTDTTDPEKAIYYEAIAIQAVESRAAYLDAACRHDTELRERVQSLLDADEGAGGFLGSSPLDSLFEPSERNLELSKDAEGAGATIGRYKLLEKIGEGGFGVVFMAEQREPIHRRVALKIIKAGMDTKQVIARFEAERQALSLMNHANIATVLDAGATDSGRPFFVMELVHGVPVTQYCDEHHLSMEQRLNLFADICAAIQHAHQKGIIHRDIKPNNVLVTTDGDRPVAKVIDFGIAKAVQGRLTDKTLFTQFHQFIGTPAYMSPEQAQMSARNVDTRTDIYSLGVLLYELLTGGTPLDAEKLQNAALDEVCRSIREEEPPKPSTRLSTMTKAERAETAQKRQTVPEKLGRLVRGELDWIVMKAIEKDRTRRYATAEALAADVARYLANEPVEAGPPSIAYRLRKFASRNRVAVSTTVAVALALIVGTIASTVLLVEARRAQRGLEVAQGELTGQLSETQRAQGQAELNLYVSDMNRVATAYDESNIGLALSLLAKHEASYGDRFEWRCLRRLCQGDALHTFRQHSGPVNSVAVSPQGVIASGSSDGMFRLFDIKTKQEIASRKMSSGVRRVEFTPDGQVLVVAEGHGEITFWNVDPLEQKDLELPRGFADVALSPDGVTLAVSGRRLSLWNWETPNVPAVVVAGGGGGFMSFSPTGRFLSLVSPTPKVNLLEVTKEGVYERYAYMPLAHDWSVLDSAFSRPDEKYLATVGKGGQIRMWELAEIRRAELAGKSAKPVSILQGKRSSHGARTLSFSPDGRYLASGGRTGNINLWRGGPPWRPEESELLTLRGHTAAVTSIAYSHDGALLVSGSKDHTVKLWPGDLRRESASLATAEDWIYAVAFSPDGRLLATGGFDGRVRLFDTETMKKTFDEKLHDNQVLGVAISPSGQWLASCEGGWRWAHGVTLGSPGQGISLVNLKNREERYYFDEIPTGVLGAIDFSPDSRSLVIGDNNGDLWLVDVQQRRVARKKTGEGGQGAQNFRHLRYSPDGKTFAAVGGKGLELRSAKTLDLLHVFGGAGRMGGVDFSVDGKLLACARGQTITLLDATSLKPVGKPLEGHSGIVYGLAFLPDGKTLASCSTDGTVKLWNLESRKEVATLRGHRGPVTGLAASHDGNMIASSGEDKTVRIWRATPLAPIEK
ncbi:MAG: protein kinase [Planctomycetes bacterium]|nr:protein kinase [Planctomycetota bacterium]